MTTFSLNWDYRCPYARNANEHVVAALRGGADWEVEFIPFSLTAVHVEEGQPDVWDDPEKAPELLALQVGMVVHDWFPQSFWDVHLGIFAARHEEDRDIRDEEVLRDVLRPHGLGGPVFAMICERWPVESLRKAHEAQVADHLTFGVPTFVMGDEAVFVRLMTRPEGDAELARATVEKVLGLLEHSPELNEYKHTTVKR
ncbi:MAG: protein-disulfide isomerase [Acidimicrobiales bacterium]